jgi:hypothetical protein
MPKRAEARRQTNVVENINQLIGWTWYHKPNRRIAPWFLNHQLAVRRDRGRFRIEVRERGQATDKVRRGCLTGRSLLRRRQYFRLSIRVHQGLLISHALNTFITSSP